MVWDTACRPTDDPFWAVLSPGAQEPVQPPNNICSLSAAEKKNFRHSSKKDNHPGPLLQQGFCTSPENCDELSVAWQTVIAVFFFSFAISRASSLKHSYAFHEPVLDFACLCESFLRASFKTILAALFRTFGLPLRFLLSKPSLFHDHFTTQHSDFPSFLVAITTDKPVNRRIHAYALT